jgi:predicted metal-dependent peptidase
MGGGTDMPAIFTQIEKENFHPDALIILTDMYTDYGDAPGYPVIWVATSDKVASHGETIQIHVGQ